MAAAVVAVLPVVVLLTWGASLRDRMPEEIPSHFGANGLADAWTDTAGYWRGLVIAAVACLVVALAALLVRHGYARLLVLVTVGFVAALLASIWISTALAVLAAPSPQEASLGWAGLLLLVVLLGYPLLVLLAHGLVRREVPALAARSAARSLPLGAGEGVAGGVAGEPAAAETTLVSRAFTVLTVLLLVIAVGTAWALAAQADAAFGVTMGLVLGLSTLLVASYARVHVSADARGLRLISWCGIPVRRVPLAQIVTVAVTQIEPMEWGGWGYRWTPGRAAFVLRRGPGLVLGLADGRQFAVTLPDPEPFAAALAAHRHPPTAGAA